MLFFTGLFGVALVILGVHLLLKRKKPQITPIPKIVEEFLEKRDESKKKQRKPRKERK